MTTKRKKPARKRAKPTPATTKPTPASTLSSLEALEQAIGVRQKVVSDLESCHREERPKLVDAYARAANVVRQLEKDRKKAIASYTDDELVEYLRSLPGRRRDAIVIAAQGASLAGKPLF
jgi:hypothetical protein